MADRRNDAGPRPEVPGTKLELRRSALAARDALPGAERARLSVAVCARAAALSELDAAATIMLFAAFRSEVDTEPLISWPPSSSTRPVTNTPIWATRRVPCTQGSRSSTPR
jgi:hypothetical protein